MKKSIFIAAIVAGALALLSVLLPLIIGFAVETPMPDSVGIIGGADGPTAIMMIGTIGTSEVMITIVIGVLLIVTGIWGLGKIKKKSC